MHNKWQVSSNWKIAKTSRLENWEVHVVLKQEVVGEPDARVCSRAATPKLCKSRNRLEANKFIFAEFWHAQKFGYIFTQHNFYIL